MAYCTAKMILGYSCLSERVLNRIEVDEAKHRVSEFKVVGLQGERRRSIRICSSVS